MGMYTELHFNVELKKDVPDNILEVLRYMLDIEKEEPTGLDHQLFTCDQWRWMFLSDSYYFRADTHSTLRFDDISDAHLLCIRCNLKNYDSEIEIFIDWIMPFVEAYPDDFLGFYRYEETEQPTLIYYPKEETPPN